MTTPLSRSVEDYLKAIWQVAREGDAATSELAARLAVAPPSVTGMIKRLAEAGHVVHEPYRGVRLTAQGRLAAMAVIRRHRVIETYLIMKLGYDWSNVHEEAERLEHAVSDTMVERMSFALGHPRYDPHGAPIPTPDGEIEEVACVTLDQVEVGSRVALRQVEDDDPERLRYLKSIGMLPATALEIIDRQPFGGPITVRVGERETRDRVIGPALAASLLVERL